MPEAANQNINLSVTGKQFHQFYKYNIIIHTNLNGKHNDKDTF